WTGSPIRYSRNTTARTRRRSPATISICARPRFTRAPPQSRKISSRSSSWIFSGAAMDFNYSNEQLALQDTLQRFIARDYGYERRRELSRSARGFSAEAWAQYADLGLLSLPFPEEFGGLGGNAVDIMLVMELVGRGLLLEPFLSTIVMCGGLIRDAASEPLKRTMLPRIGAGELKL